MDLFKLAMDGISEGLGAVGGVADTVTKAVGEAGATAVDAIGGAVGVAATDIYSSFGGTVDIEQEGNLKLPDGSYHTPNPMVDDAETDKLDSLTKLYDNLNRPGLIARAGGAIADAMPAPIKDAVGGVGQAMSEAELYQAAMKIVAEGFGAVEKQAASATVSSEYVINRINRGRQEQKVSSIEEVCLLRSYDVTRVVSAERAGHLGLALAEGAATGVPGFAGIPFNLVLSTFLFFRAVQSIAMFYGYDVHGDPSEMIIAGDVIIAAYGAGDQGPNGSVAVGCIGKIMAISQAEAARQMVGKGWTAMASHGGVTLLLTQLRALAHASARKALVNAGKQGLEKNVLNSVFEQIGRRLTQNTIKGAVPVVSGVIGALFDAGVMNRMLDFAEVFYHKRFILEKPLRIRSLVEGTTFFDTVSDTTDIDVEEVIDEAEVSVEGDK